MSKLTDALAKLHEADNFGQFAGDFDQPQAKPVRAAIRVVAGTDVAELVADGERFRYITQICHAADGGDVTAQQVLEDVELPDIWGGVELAAIMLDMRTAIDEMRKLWQPLNWE